MRWIHFRWLYGASFFLRIAGAFCILSQVVASVAFRMDGWSLGGYGILLTASSLIPAVIANLVLFFMKGSGLTYPSSPEGKPVDPSGVWLNPEAPITIGMLVLAVMNDRWHRAVVVGLRSRDRVLVHFLGWSDFWDDVIPRHRLQQVATEAHDDALPGDTRIRGVVER